MQSNAPRFVRIILIGAIFCVFVGITVVVTGKALLKDLSTLSESDQSFTTADGGSCDIAVIPMVGELFASEDDASAEAAGGNSAVSAESILEELERAEDDDSIKGVVLRIDSPGGSPVAGSLIANALKRLSKPSVALIWDEGDSAAYLAATGATTIIASPSSNIGDIGVTGSYIDQSKQDATSGDNFISIVAGANKDVGNPDYPLTPAGQALLQQEVDETYQNLIQEISQNRGLSIDAVKKLASGTPFVASFATSTGLIDSLGDSSAAQAWFSQKLGKNSSPVLCE